MSYLDELARELRAVGIGGRLQRRIVAEIADHLASDPAAELGTPVALAQQFADELGAARTRRAALLAFAALALAGCAYTTVFVAASVANIRIPDLHARTPVLGDLAFATSVAAPQLAFVAGVLAALRALRRREVVLPSAEVRIVLRRTTLALAAGLATMAALALLAYEYSPGLPQWLRLVAWASAGTGGAALLAAASSALAAARPRVGVAGAPGDVFADLGPLVPTSLRGRPCVFALAVAAAVLAAVTAAGIVQSDPFDGALRGLVDGAGVLAGFALLGRYLGLRGQ